MTELKSVPTDYTHYTSDWVLPNKNAETCAAANHLFQACVDSIGYEVKLFRCHNGRGQYDNKTFRLVLAARGVTMNHVFDTLTIRMVSLNE
jgi:hypothetical protein